MTGFTIRVDRFDQVQVVNADLVFRYDVMPLDPDDDGAYDVSSVPARPFKTGDLVDAYEVEGGFVYVAAGTDLTDYGFPATPTHSNVLVTDTTTKENA